MSDRGDEEPQSGLDLWASSLDRQRLLLWGVTGLIVLALGYFAWQFIGTIIVGVFVYYVCRPLFRRIHGRVKNRTLAVIVTLLTVALPTLALIGWTLFVLFQAIADFAASRGSDQIQAIVQPYLDVSTQFGSLEEVVRQVSADPQQIGPLVSDLAGGLVSTVSVVGNVGIRAFIVVVIVFYLLRDDIRLAAWSRRTVISEGSIVEHYLARVDDDLANVFFGNILNALVTGLIAAVSYFLLNRIAPAIVTIPQPAFVGILVGVASLVPAVGIKLVTWPVGAYLFARSAFLDPTTFWFPVVFFAVTVVVVDAIPDQLLRPYVSGRSLNVGAVMLSYLFGPILFGWHGIFLGPFLLVVVYNFGLVVVPWLTREEPPQRETEVEEAEDDSAAEATTETGADESDTTAQSE